MFDQGGREFTEILGSRSQFSHEKYHVSSDPIFTDRHLDFNCVIQKCSNTV